MSPGTSFCGGGFRTVQGSYDISLGAVPRWAHRHQNTNSSSTCPPRSDQRSDNTSTAPHSLGLGSPARGAPQCSYQGKALSCRQRRKGSGVKASTALDAHTSHTIDYTAQVTVLSFVAARVRVEEGAAGTHGPLSQCADDKQHSLLWSTVCASAACSMRFTAWVSSADRLGSQPLLRIDWHTCAGSSKRTRSHKGADLVSCAVGTGRNGYGQKPDGSSTPPNAVSTGFGSLERYVVERAQESEGGSRDDWMQVPPRHSALWAPHTTIGTPAQARGTLGAAPALAPLLMHVALLSRTAYPQLLAPQW